MPITRRLFDCYGENGTVRVSREELKEALIESWLDTGELPPDLKEQLRELEAFEAG